MRYKYSINVNENSFDSLEHMFKTLNESGYRAIDGIGGKPISDDALEEKNYCDEYKRLAKKYDIELFQGHAPIVIYESEEKFLSKEFRDRTFKRLERMARMGIRYAATHGYVPEGIDFFRNAKVYDYKKLEEHNREINLEFWNQFVPFLKQEGIMLCIENLFAYDIILRHHVASVSADPNETLYYINQLGSDCFGACYDSGHLNHFAGDEYKFITTLGEHLKITHFHDSWGKDFGGMDWHHLPGDGDVDWEAVRKGLLDINYKGTINAEIGINKPARLKYVKLKYVADSLKALLED